MVSGKLGMGTGGLAETAGRLWRTPRLKLSWVLIGVVLAALTLAWVGILDGLVEGSMEHLRGRAALNFQSLEPSKELPELFILGMQKCGTTSLAIWLTKHLEGFKFSKRGKEVHFFNKNFDKGIEWYRSSYDDLKLEDVDEGSVLVDGTPNYFGHSLIPDLMKQVLVAPRLRFIITVKDPARRAWSWYRHSTLKFSTAESYEALQCSYRVYDMKFTYMAAAVPPIIRNCLDSAPEGKQFETCAHDSAFWNPSTEDCSTDAIQPWTLWMWTAGLYGPMLEFWLKHFDASQFCVTAYDLLITNFAAEGQYLKPCIENFGMTLNIPQNAELDNIAVKMDHYDECETCEQVGDDQLLEIGAFVTRTLYKDSNEKLRRIMKEVYGREYFPVWENTYLPVAEKE